MEELINKQIETSEDFEWEKQLRYYWEQGTKMITVKILTSKLDYGYEYLGC